MLPRQARIPFLIHHCETSKGDNRQCLRGWEHTEDTPEVEPQWVRDKMSPFTSERARKALCALVDFRDLGGSNG